MRLIIRLFTLVLALAALPVAAEAAEGASVHALLIAASNQKGDSDQRLARYEATLRRNLPFESFRLVGEGSATVSPDGATLSLARGHKLELATDRAEGRGIRLRVRWLDDGREVMTTSLVLQPGVPAVLGRRGGDEGEVPVILMIAR